MLSSGVLELLSVSCLLVYILYILFQSAPSRVSDSVAIVAATESLNYSTCH